MKHDTPEAKLERIRQLCAELGWEVALNDSNEEVHGLVVGNIEFIEQILTGDIDPEEFSVYSSSDSQELH